MNVIIWTSTAAVLLLLTCAVLLNTLLKLRRESAGQRRLLAKQQDQLRLIRKKLYRLGKEMQAATQNAAAVTKAHRALAKQHSAIQETTPTRIRRHLALADTSLSQRIAASTNRREQLEMQEKRDAIRTIMQLLISTRLESELVSAALKFTVSDKKDALVRRRVNEMFPKVPVEPYRPTAS